MPPQLMPPSQGNPHAWGRWLLTFICLTVVVVSIYFSAFQSNRESVRVVVRDAGGARAVYQVSLSSGSLTQETDVDLESVSTVPTRIFRLADGSIVTLNDTGVVTRQGSSKGPLSVLLSSTKRPTLTTPFAVWGDAEKIAWVNPADESLQIFERTPRGSYSPIFLDSKIRANSIAFSSDGTALIAAQVTVTQAGAASSQLFVIDPVRSTVSDLTTITGFATIVP